jgi:hypothetical protein
VRARRAAREAINESPYVQRRAIPGPAQGRLAATAEPTLRGYTPASLSAAA